MPDLPLPEVGNITATAVLGWYAWHTATRTVPQMLDAFRQELAALRAAFRRESEALREELITQRYERQEDQRALAEAIQRGFRP